jgi:hypothetical protein
MLKKTNRKLAPRQRLVVNQLPIDPSLKPTRAEPIPTSFSGKPSAHDGGTIGEMT